MPELHADDEQAMPDPEVEFLREYVGSVVQVAPVPVF
jgi:hypothetical protein